LFEAKIESLSKFEKMSGFLRHLRITDLHFISKAVHSMKDKY